MKRVLFDTNIILDIALQREPFFRAACQLFGKIDDGTIKGFVTALSVTDIYYMSKKARGRENAIAFICELIDILDVLNVTKNTVIYALNADFKDFEDAVQYFVADMNGIDIIVTRNNADFEFSAIEICTPNELMKKLNRNH